MMRILLMMIFGLFCMVCSPGCQKQAIPTAAVSGVVRMDGVPLENVTVTCVGDKGISAYGVTDSSGRYSLSTFKTGDGAVPGPASFAVTSNEPDEPGKSPPPGSIKRKLGKYVSPGSSGLKFEIQSGKNVFDIELIGNSN